LVSALFTINTITASYSNAFSVSFTLLYSPIANGVDGGNLQTVVLIEYAFKFRFFFGFFFYKLRIIKIFYVVFTFAYEIVCLVIVL